MLAAADEKEGNGPLKVDPIVGAWVTVVTVRDCVSGTPFFSFNGGTLIAHGGTLTTTDYEPNPSRAALASVTGSATRTAPTSGSSSSRASIRTGPWPAFSASRQRRSWAIRIT